MPLISLTTKIRSSIEICFDLSRSVDLHRISTVRSKEIVVDGKSSGLLGLGESVTWQATHFGIRQRLTSRITRFDRPGYFRDSMVDGTFKSFHHDHRFSTYSGFVLMTDEFRFESPMGILGDIFNRLVLTGYMTKLLEERNSVIKDYAETEKWKSVVHL